MHVEDRRTYVALRFDWETDRYEPLGTVVARTHDRARRIARRRWPAGVYEDAPHVRAAGSVRIGVLLEALARDGEGRRSRPDHG